MVRTIEPGEVESVAEVHRVAFGSDVEAGLAQALMLDPAFVPSLSFVAEADGRLIGSVIFTRVWLERDDGAPALPLLLLAPLAVVPEAQCGGVGSMLVESAITLGAESGEIAMLVLGHPEYYPRFGFGPALPRGIRAPYPIDPPEAWMVLDLAADVPGSLAGVVRVAEPLSPAEMWRE